MKRQMAWAGFWCAAGGFFSALEADVFGAALLKDLVRLDVRNEEPLSAWIQDGGVGSLLGIVPAVGRFVEPAVVVDFMHAPVSCHVGGREEDSADGIVVDKSG